jgi:hypothetical protein
MHNFSSTKNPQYPLDIYVCNTMKIIGIEATE